MISALKDKIAVCVEGHGAIQSGWGGLCSSDT